MYEKSATQKGETVSLGKLASAQDHTASEWRKQSSDPCSQALALARWVPVMSIC